MLKGHLIATVSLFVTTFIYALIKCPNPILIGLIILLGISLNFLILQLVGIALDFELSNKIDKESKNLLDKDNIIADARTSFNQKSFDKENAILEENSNRRRNR